MLQRSKDIRAAKTRRAAPKDGPASTFGPAPETPGGWGADVSGEPGCETVEMMNLRFPTGPPLGVKAANLCYLIYRKFSVEFGPCLDAPGSPS